ncbi:MAG: DNA polymerase III subunit delta [Boseongicola sp. SB0667_bin_21]|nr:DNA polymerase III subunit delta [Boseongicola sp. SB0667_bin_21]
MKLSTRNAPAYFAKPDETSTGLLIHGADAMRVALRRQEVIKALIGPGGEDEMRLTRIPAAELRKDTALLADAVKARSFFPGLHVAYIEGAGDGLADTIAAALADWSEGDAQVIVTAGSLPARSKLRGIFENHENAYATGIYDDPPSRAETEAALKAAGLTNISADAMSSLAELSRVLDPGEFGQTLEKIALYKSGDETPLTPDEIALSGPSSVEAGIDDVLNVATDGKTHEVGPVLRRLEAQGTTPVSLCIGATRHFRRLHLVAADPAGPGAGASRLRPPVFGPRRDRLQRQATRWGMRKLERALAILLDTDLKLRSGARIPEMAVMERALLRIAFLGRR